ncbi:MAG: threonylcarbamoyl-AMP synthase [Oscillospiraceae bacterium]|jgi:L-threonylcarbamoyladenylate synthase|nr:threonylcarbamoyl-AMP synthase [Oscillospiraceae bacterium]
MNKHTQRLCAARPEDIAVAAALLRRGGLVAIPTETVYGLAANAFDPQAVAAVFAAKGRPQDNPLIVHVPCAGDAHVLTRRFSARASALAAQFWPGPLTLILPKSEKVPDAVSAGLDTVALRVPAHPGALALLLACGCPLAAPSANRSGSPSPTTARHVLEDLDGRIDAVLDAGPCRVGVESTVLSLVAKTPCLLRPGAVTLEQLRQALGEVTVAPSLLQALGEGEVAASPGMKYRHYAPKAALTLLEGASAQFAAYVAAHALEGDGALCFEEDLPALECALEPEQRRFPVLCCGAATDAEAQARQLFARLRELDSLGLRRVFVRCPAKEGVGLAVFNRLLRAAAFRLIELEG